MIKYKGLSTLEVLIEAKNYNKWIADEIKVHLNAPVLEVGAGTGNITEQCLLKKPIYVTECDKGLVKVLYKKFSNVKNVYVQHLNITGREKKEFKNFFTSAFAVNVLEHIIDDEKALKNIRNSLKYDGKLVILVPAKKFAFTKLDYELGHVRRYEKKELRKKLEDNGYIVEKIYYFNIVGLVSWYVRDKIKKNNFHLKPYQITVFDSIVPFLRMIESKIKPPIGISLIAVARKV